MLAYILILMGFFMRLVPHAPNMAPVAAIALFAGAYLDRRIVPWVPLVIMILSDLIIGMHDVVPYTWGAFILVGFMGMRLRDNKKPGNLFGASVLSAFLFFAISNFGVWLSWYPHTVSGFTDCFVKAVPFFRNTLISNVVFTFVFFGLYESARKLAVNSRYKDLLFASE